MHRLLSRALLFTLSFISIAFAVVPSVTDAALLTERYEIPFGSTAHGMFRDAALTAVARIVAIYDPTQPKQAVLGPEEFEGLDRYRRLEDVFSGAELAALRVPLQLEDLSNAQIIGSRYSFRYQPFDDTRLQELRRRYRLDDVMAGGRSELGRIVRLRHWVRTRFRRSDYQPFMTNFDGLAILDRNMRNHGETYDPAKHFDPCHFFPLLLAQALVSVGHQARLVSVGHGMVEVWSNQFGKWFLVDAELDYHVERNGIPLNMLELAEAVASGNTSDLHLSASPREPSDENPTMSHLRLERLTATQVASWFAGTFEITEMRNDWITNWYFRGHPARSETSSLVFVAPTSRIVLGRDYVQRRRPRTTDPSDMYWTLNQSEILALPPDGDVLPLAFRTVTPNFDRFEIEVDGQPTARQTHAMLEWKLQPGRNHITVRAVNRFGVSGAASSAMIETHERQQTGAPRGTRQANRRLARENTGSD